MNQTDKGLYKALYYLSQRKRKKLSENKREKIFSEGMMKTLFNMSYAKASGDSTILTDLGLTELRKLESIRKSEWTLIISIIAIIVSFASLAFSLFLKYSLF